MEGVVIEDCNDAPDWDDGRARGDPTKGCAVSGGGYYRTGGDVKGNWASIMNNVMGMAQHLQKSTWGTPQTRPGCWPTPDALEVGCTRQGTLGMNATEARSHFGMWAITSSPLILGLDFRDKAAVDFAWPIIANKEVLAVNRAWPASTFGGGTPGRLVLTDGAWAGGRIMNKTKQVWAKNVSATSVAVLFVNVGDTPQSISVAFDAAAAGGPTQVREDRDVNEFEAGRGAVREVMLLREHIRRG